LIVDIKKLKSLTLALTILYIEDDLSIKQKMSKYLSKFFAEVLTAENGLEGIEYFEKDKFDIVITDLSMPKMNGLDMISKIKEIDENQVILITTAHGESTYLMNAINAHVDGYILKPFDYNSLNFELFKISQKIRKFKENEEYKQNLQQMVKQQTKVIKENYEKTLYSMVELIEKRDTYTAGHSKRVAKYSQMIAKDMGCSEDECTLIYQAGILHDIGKIETPDSVLLNPKKLNDIEYKLIQEHVSVGYNLLRKIPMFASMAEIIYSHHEKYDGSGYPNGLKGENINKLSRIMIVADAFDAMTTSRIYKAKKSVEVAIEEMVSLSKKHFDPDVVSSALRVLKDVEIDVSIDQLPHTKLEEERFSYFYNDTLSQAYNQNYLDLVLMKNHYEKEYKSMIIFSINKFSLFNKEFSWLDGDNFLKEFANILTTNLDESLVFRVFGDDFVVLNKEEIDIKGVLKVLDKLIVGKIISYNVKHIDLTTTKVETLDDIEIIQKTTNRIF
jgi:putative nucleotidyltransferase with HDIG domain